MMKPMIGLAAAALAIAIAAPALAHHSGAMFDREKSVSLVGTLKEVQFIAPHGWIEMLVPDPKTGKVTQWSIETAPTGSRLFTMGFSRSSPGPGEKITVVAHPLRDGRPGGSLVTLTTADGRVLPQRPAAGANAVAPAAPPPAAPAEAPLKRQGTVMTFKTAAARLAAALLLSGVSAAAFAQPFQPLAATPLDTDKRNGPEYGAAFAQMPDWNGVWAMIQPAAIFDPSTAENINDGNAGGDFGIIAGGREHPPYKPEFEKIYTERVRRSKVEGINEDTVANCRVQGMPRVFSVPQDIDIVVLPKVTFMIWAQFGNVRHIYTDGRGHPDPDLSAPTDMGHSIGRWEGSKLIVDTVAMLPGNYDQSGPPYSDKLHTIETFQMLPNGRLQVEIISEDPVMLTKPWRVVREMQRVRLSPQVAAIPGPGPNWSDVEMVYCTNNRNAIGANGGQSVQLMSDLADAPPGSVDAKPVAPPARKPAPKPAHKP